MSESFSVGDAAFGSQQSIDCKNATFAALRQSRSRFQRPYLSLFARGVGVVVFAPKLPTVAVVPPAGKRMRKEVRLDKSSRPCSRSQLEK